MQISDVTQKISTALVPAMNHSFPFISCNVLQQTREGLSPMKLNSHFQSSVM